MRKLLVACLMGFVLATSGCIAHVHPSYLSYPAPAPIQYYTPTHRHVGKVIVKKPAPRRHYHKKKFKVKIKIKKYYHHH